MKRLQCRRPVTVGETVIGGAAPLICLPLVADTIEDLLQQARDLMPLAPDMLEWRVDGFGAVSSIDDSLEALTALRNHIGTTPLIFTCRSHREGGMSPIAAKDRLALITAAVATDRVDLVDAELCNGPGFIREVVDAAGGHGVKVILSAHDFEKTPDKETIFAGLVHAQTLGADIAKTAVMPRSYGDVLVLLEATLKARTEALDIPMITIAMGNEGAVTRIAGGLFGSDITFAAGKAASAPGQIPIGALRQAMGVLYR